jgi:hypothetical protein
MRWQGGVDEGVGVVWIAIGTVFIRVQRFDVDWVRRSEGRMLVCRPMGGIGSWIFVLEGPAERPRLFRGRQTPPVSQRQS